MRRTSSVKLLVLLSLFCFNIGFANADETAYWEGVNKGQVLVLMRHALAPGTGDPLNFTVDDCSTQRNLSEEGQAQSRRIGELLKAEGVTQAELFSSQWCRCMDTAAGLGIGGVEALPALNSFFRERERAQDQTKALEIWLKARIENALSTPTLPAVLVSHQVNITALTNVYPSSGEMVFIGLKNDELVVLGTQLIQ